jgi:ribokinase
MVVGSINMDLIIKVDRLPKTGESLLGSKTMLAHGGKGANQAVAIARLGGQTHLVGKVGSDAFGEQIRRELDSAGVDTTFVGNALQTLTGIALIMLVEGENSIVVSPGANNEVGRADIDKAGTALERSQVLLTQLEIPLDTVAYAMQKAGQMGSIVILDPGPARECPTDILALSDYITPNQTEAYMLTGIEVFDQETARHAAQKLLEYARQGVIIKMGAAGALVLNREIDQYVEAIPVEVVDTTAAGDAFCAALAIGLTSGMPFTEAARFANVVAAITVTRLGAQPSIPTLSEVEGFVAERQLLTPLPSL